MRLRWTGKALSDLTRLHDFLATQNAPAAARAVQTLVAAAGRLVEHPRLGTRLEEFVPSEVRRLRVGHYEMRYEVRASEVYLLRISHAREDR